MPVIKVPHQTPEEIFNNSQQEDPYVMYYVVRSGSKLDLGQAMVLAGAGAVLCSDQYSKTEKWSKSFSDWYQESYRKVVLRATEEEFAQAQELDSVSLSSHQGEMLLCLPPRRKSEREDALLELKPFTDAKKANLEVGEHDPLSIYYIIRPEVFKSAGKAMAQAGHASLMCAHLFAEEYAEELKEWREKGCPGVVLAAQQNWEFLKNNLDCSYVTDAGLTQVDPGTETVLVIPPTAMDNEILLSLTVVP